MRKPASLMTLFALYAFCNPTLAANTAYFGVGLFPITYPSGNHQPHDISGGNVVGVQFDPQQAVHHALLWTRPNGDLVDLHPTNLAGILGSIAHANEGGQQVGSGYSASFQSRAMLWIGTADSAIDLHPTHLSDFTASESFGTNGFQQVGLGVLSSGDFHALAWTGTAESAMDLHPTSLGNFRTSIAYDTDGSHQVGSGAAAVDDAEQIHALLWNGTSESAIDLHPTHLSGIDSSQAFGVSGSQQVGVGGVTRAFLWNGTPESAVDLHPTQFGEVALSTAWDTNGTQQVGSAEGGLFGNGPHAVLWYGSADSALNLHHLLPDWLTTSAAYSIDADGTIYGIAYDDAFAPYAVMWAPVPEPMSLALLAGCATILMAASSSRKQRQIQAS